MLTIRLANVADVPLMQAIEVDAGELFRSIGLDAIADDPPPSSELLSAHIGRGTAWVAVLDSQLVGYATASIADDEAHLDQVSLLRTASRRGIGACLISEVCTWARGLAYPTVTLTTFRDVAWNGPYYARLGFVVVPDEECGPQLTAVRKFERYSGIEALPRVAMRLRLPSWTN